MLKYERPLAEEFTFQVEDILTASNEFQGVNPSGDKPARDIYIGGDLL